MNSQMVIVIRGSAYDGADARPRPNIPIIPGIALHPWIKIINRWCATHFGLTTWIGV